MKFSFPPPPFFFEGGGGGVTKATISTFLRLLFHTTFRHVLSRCTENAFRDLILNILPYFLTNSYALVEVYEYKSLDIPFGVVYTILTSLDWLTGLLKPYQVKHSSWTIFKLTNFSPG